MALGIIPHSGGKVKPLQELMLLALVFSLCHSEGHEHYCCQSTESTRNRMRRDALSAPVPEPATASGTRYAAQAECRDVEG